MKVHHLNCATMCPFGGRLLGGEGSMLKRHTIVGHVFLIELGDGLALVDTGFGSGDVARPTQLGRPFLFGFQAKPRIEETALAQVQALGFEPSDVRHLILTHLDVDHAGGLPDFPDAEVHILTPERRSMEKPGIRHRERYRRAHFAHGPRWVEHQVAGDQWFGFQSVTALPETDHELALVPLAGHTRGHTGVAVRGDDGWLLHAGDAFFNRGEIETPPSCPAVLRGFQRAMCMDNPSRVNNQERLRELARDRGDEVRIVCAHDPVQFESCRG